MKKLFTIIIFLFLMTGIIFAQVSQSEIKKMETELNLFKIDLDKVEKHRSELDLQKETQLDLMQMQYYNFINFLELAKSRDNELNDQLMRNMRLILQQQHNLTKQLFGVYL